MFEVLKFGGSSLKTEETRNQVINQIQKRLSTNQKVVVVISAMGRYPDPYATDTLKSLVQNPSKEEMDLLLSCGEIISCVVLSDALKKAGISSTTVNTYETGIITTKDFNDASVLQVNTEYILKYLNDFEVVVVPGFQGITSDQRITTLGRGGSDYTAVLLAGSLGCKKVSIFSDVLGVMTANPKDVSDAKLIREINYEEIIHMSYQGAKVIHHKAVEYAKEKGLEIELYSTFYDECGTIIRNSSSSCHPLGICGIGSFVDLTFVEIDDTKKINAERIFKELADAFISLDFLYVALKKVNFTVYTEDFEKTKQVLDELGVKAKYRTGCAKIAVVGMNMKGKVGIMEKVVGPLIQNNINIYQTADSHSTIWLLVNEKDLKNALNLIHKSFNLDGGN